MIAIWGRLDEWSSGSASTDLDWMNSLEKKYMLLGQMRLTPFVLYMSQYLKFQSADEHL